MINAFIGKVQPDDSILYIYCHDHADMSILGQILLQKYSSEKNVDKLLKAGHCYFPNNITNKTWVIANNKKFIAGGECCYCEDKENYLETAVNDVQIAYLFIKGKWRYLNALSTTLAFVAVKTSPGGRMASTTGSSLRS